MKPIKLFVEIEDDYGLHCIWTTEPLPQDLKFDVVEVRIPSTPEADEIRNFPEDNPHIIFEDIVIQANISDLVVRSDPATEGLVKQLEELLCRQ